MALKRPETACPGTENVGDFDGRPGHGCRYRHMTRTLHQPITCAKAKTAATAAPAASFLPTNQPGTVSKLYSLLRGRSADMTFKVIGVPYPDTNEESWEIVLRRVGEHPNNVYWLGSKKFPSPLLGEQIR